jgi:hypothetical protein
MLPFGHHTKSYLGIEIDINDKPFPDGSVDHALVFGALLLMVYGAYALVRDVLRWRRRGTVPQGPERGS